MIEFDCASDFCLLLTVRENYNFEVYYAQLK